MLFASPVPKFEGDKVNAVYSEKFVDYVDIVASFNKQPVRIIDMYKSRIMAYQNAHHYLGEAFLALSKNAASYREIPGRDNQLAMLAKGRVDYLVGEQNVLHSLAHTMYPNKTLYTNLVLKQWDLRAGSHDKALMAKFNKGLAIIKSKGEIRKTYQKYQIIQ